MRIPVKSLPQAKTGGFWAKFHGFLFAKGKITVYITVLQKTDSHPRVLRIHFPMPEATLSVRARKLAPPVNLDTSPAITSNPF